MTSQTNGLNRRQFLKSSAAAASAVAMPMFVPASVFGANERIVTGHIGVGGQGRGNLGRFIKNAGAVCDVDQTHLAKAAKMVEDKGRKCKTFSDYRELLDQADIDAVVISTPDHWHALPTIHACQAGKDVYCEKPLSLTIGEGRLMVEAARAHKRVVQTGSQQRSAKNFRTACELVRSGHIGKLQTVLVGIPGPNHPGEPVPNSEPPEELDYEFWLGPAPNRPYNKKRVHYNFRFFRDYSGGQMTNWGAHHIDIAQWGMGTDDTGPVEIVGEGTYHPKGWHEVTETCRITHRYANGVELIVGQKQKDIPTGTTFVGSEGKIYVNRGKLRSEPGEIVENGRNDGDVELYVSNNHVQNFLDCIKSREKPICDVEIGHRSATVCHLGNLAVRLGRKLQWDAEAERFVNDEQANKELMRDYRSPWTLKS
ncbi:Gfo/Idh/MocA family protein [Thalassoroseus pseudoceratinae]|uniref:Gfo/Idh/MocA family protein n=1 Tax=Thalassoroseus pseudoceratinae TaxID=2713176 RepID=UPI001423547D|nr:Gfo/Idh/MocA family oxidoreductase [Thalassoroseus pseudoceratinae]